MRRLRVAGDDERLRAVATRHVAHGGIHLAGLGSVAHRELVLHRCQTQRADHHGRQRVGELALEHRAFAGHDAVVLWNLVVQERREHWRQHHLARVAEVAFAQLEVLAHDRELDAFFAQDVPHLAQHLLDAYVRAGVARAVVTGEQELQARSRRPRLTPAQHPTHLGQLDQPTDPRDECFVHHGCAPPGTAWGQSRYG